MAGAKCRVAAALDIVLRAAKAEHKEHAESFFSPGEVLRWVHGAEDIIDGDAPVEGCGKLLDSVSSDELVEVVFGDRGGVWVARRRCGGCVVHGRWRNEGLEFVKAPGYPCRPAMVSQMGGVSWGLI